MSKLTQPVEINKYDIISVTGLKNWIKKHLNLEEVSESTLQILFPKIKELVRIELDKAGSNNYEEWNNMLIDLERKINK